MAKYITEEFRDSNLAAAMTTFLSEVESNEAVLGIDSKEVEAISESITTYKEDFNALVAAKALLKSSATQKNASKQISRALIAQYAQEWRSNPSIPDSLLTLLQLPPHSIKGVRTPPTQPLDLRLVIGGDGMITLAWDRNGNNTTTIFNIESATGPNGPWSTFDMTTKVKIKFPWKYGDTLWFRVSARRNNQQSAYSQLISLFAESAEQGIKAA
jgi:hypothetical protein